MITKLFPAFKVKSPFVQSMSLASSPIQPDHRKKTIPFFLQQAFPCSWHIAYLSSPLFTSFSFCQPRFLNSSWICLCCFCTLWLICIFPERLHLKLAYNYFTNMDEQMLPL